MSKSKEKQNIPNCQDSSKSNIKIVKTGNIETPNAYIHDNSLSWLGTDTSVKSGRIKLFLGDQKYD